MPELPPELLMLVPLSLAAGVDLYLTLLFIGAAPTTPWWEHPLPGSLGDLDSLGVLVTVGGFYVLEFVAERFPPSALVWNAFHAVIRPVSGALLALLLLEGQGLLVILPGALVAAALASLAHAIRSGAAILSWLTPAVTPHALLVSIFEDVLVLGIVAVSLDRPAVALAASAGLVLAAAPAGPSHVRAFAFAVRLATARAFQTLVQRRWLGQDELPDWVRRALAGDVLAPGGGLRGSPAGAHRLPGAPRFSIGWVVVRGGPPLFVRRGSRPASVVELEGLRGENVEETAFFRRVDLGAADGPRACVYFSVNGPSAESLRAEFLVE